MLTDRQQRIRNRREVQALLIASCWSMWLWFAITKQFG